MRDGRVVQSGPYRDLAAAPAAPWVAEFLGNRNLMLWGAVSAGYCIQIRGSQIGAGSHANRGWSTAGRKPMWTRTQSAGVATSRPT